MTHKKAYPFIVAWLKYKALCGEETEDEKVQEIIAEAVHDKAPADAMFKDPLNGKWRTFKEIENENLRQTIVHYLPTNYIVTPFNPLTGEYMLDKKMGPFPTYIQATEAALNYLIQTGYKEAGIQFHVKPGSPNCEVYIGERIYGVELREVGKRVIHVRPPES